MNSHNNKHPFKKAPIFRSGPFPKISNRKNQNARSLVLVFSQNASTCQHLSFVVSCLECTVQNPSCYSVHCLLPFFLLESSSTMAQQVQPGQKEKPVATFKVSCYIVYLLPFVLQCCRLPRSFFTPISITSACPRWRWWHWENNVCQKASYWRV